MLIPTRPQLYSLFILLLACTPAAMAWQQDIPENIQNRSDEEVEAWVDRQIEGSYEEKLSVGRERYERAVSHKRTEVDNMRRVAEKRIAIIESAQVSKKQFREESISNFNLVVFGLTMVVTAVGVCYWIVEKNKSPQTEEY